MLTQETVVMISLLVMTLTILSFTNAENTFGLYISSQVLFLVSVCVLMLLKYLLVCFFFLSSNYANVFPSTVKQMN